MSLEQAELEPEAEVIEAVEEVVEAAETVDDDDEVIVSIGDAPPEDDEQQEEPAPAWVKELRKQNREQARRIKELETQTAPVVENKPALGDKPTLESCGWDDASFETKLAEWFDRKREHDNAKREAEAAQQAEADAWKAKLDAYEAGKAKLKVKDYDEAEAVILDTFSTTQQGIVIQGSSNPALLAYAVGKDPAKAKELAAITDPIRFAFAMGALETQVKMTSRKTPPAPEKVIHTNGPVGGSSDSTLERLRDEAARTGDYTKVAEYKRARRAA